jgi:hypothetical protein
MHDRAALGPADVTDEVLSAMVADLLRTEPEATEVRDSAATEVDYDLPALTTAGRYWVSGTARVGEDELPFRIFVKHVQAWSRSPLFQFVPEDLRAEAEAMVPWRTEALAYRSDLGDRLPEGLTMPRAVGVFDVDEKSNSVWLEAIDVVSAPWDLARYARAGHLLGRMAASPLVAERANVGGHDWHIGHYFKGRLSAEVLPTLNDDNTWRHPLIAAAFDEQLRRRLVAAAARAAAYTDELSSMPMATAHGDACPNNLLARAGSDDFTLIDYGFWGPNPIGFDLSQLLVGEMQVGRSGADLTQVEDTILESYVAGLRAEGCDIPLSVVRRAHALQLLLFTGFSTLPVEHLGAEPTPDLHQIAAERAKIARFSLGLLEATTA